MLQWCGLVTLCELESKHKRSNELCVWVDIELRAALRFAEICRLHVVRLYIMRKLCSQIDLH